jgi:hypothetical protein
MLQQGEDCPAGQGGDDELEKKQFQHENSLAQFREFCRLLS